VGLDTVEIVLTTEEVFSIELPDDECGLVVTVGDLYRLVLNKLNLPYLAMDSAHINRAAAPPGRSRLKDRYPGLAPWTSPDVSATLTAIIQDQLQVDFEEITETATFINDLRCD
jgi:acyl carrier protein